METRELICIGCPLGCPLTVRLDGEQMEISGNTCKRGEDYARKEVQNPTRIVTSNGVSEDKVRHSQRTRIFDVMDEIHKASAEAPVAIGDVIIKDCAGTGVPVIATKAVDKA